MSKRLHRPIRKVPASDDFYLAREIEEAVRSLLREVDTMPHGKHRDQLMTAIEEVMSDGDIERLYEVTKWRRTPVDLDEFLFSPVYLGLRPSEYYPGVLEDLHALDTGNYVEAVLKGAIGGGKGLPLDTPILTLGGWKVMGDVKAGDYVFDEQGQPTRVLAAHDTRKNQPCYRITFSDGTHIVADGDHNWFTQERTKNGKRTNGSVKTTDELAITVYSDCGKYKRHSIPLIHGIDTDERQVSIDPYLLGVWLGDGLADRGYFVGDLADRQIAQNVRDTGHTVDDLGWENPTGKCRRYKVRGLRPELSYYGLLQNKHIPDDFLYGSHEQRVALLQGLMDTDGYIRPTGSCEIIQKSDRLASDIMQLLWLLGLKPERRDKNVNGVNYNRITFTVYRDHFDAFRLDRKLAMQPHSGAQAIRQRSRYIVSVEPLGNIDTKCITVDSPTRLYCAGRQMQVTHNTTVANLGIIRQTYFISCLRNPQATFGVQRNSSIVFTVQSVRLSTAKKAVFQELGAYIGNSPYFTEIYPYDRRIASEMIFREQRVSILPVSSSDTGAISMNVIGGLLDEMNFLEKIKKSKKDNADVQGEYDQAKSLYLTISKRRRSRFMTRGKLPGILFLVSSSRYPDDFTELKAAESTMQGGNDPSIYVASRSLWDAKGRDRFSPTSFRVAVGNDTRRSEILPDNVPDPVGMDIISVPDDLRIEFEKDLDGSIRDLAGRTTLSTSPFIRNRESIHACMHKAEEFGYHNIFELETYDLSVALPRPNPQHIRTDVDQMRVAHVDLATTGDAAGLAVGHVAGQRTIQRVNPYTGEVLSEVLPVVAIDFAMRIIPPPNGEIDFSKIRQILFTLKEEYGLPIKILTADGFNSVDFKQIMAKKGYVTDYLSMDRTTEPYVAFKNAMLDNRVLLPRLNILVQELVQLELTRTSAKEKVDHPPKGSKDVSDAVCGVVSTLLTRRSAWTGRPQFVGYGGFMMYGSRTVQPGVQLPTADDVQRLMDTPSRKTIERKPATRRPRRET